MAINAGVVTGDLIFFALAAAGMAALARSAGEASPSCRYAGAAYLVWQGLKFWRRHPARRLQSQPAGTNGTSGAITAPDCC